MDRSSGFSGINVGRTKTGKTTVSKALISELDSTEGLYVYDVYAQRERCNQLFFII